MRSNPKPDRVETCSYDGQMVVQHAFIEKTQKIPQLDLDLAGEYRAKLETTYDASSPSRIYFR